MNPAVAQILLLAAPANAVATRDLLAGRFQVVHVPTLQDAAWRLGAEPFDAVLLEADLPDGEWLVAIAELRRAASHTPVVLLTEGEHEAMAEPAFAAGAQDVLVRGQLSADGLARALRHAIARERVAGQQLRRSEDRYHALVHSLTDGFWIADTAGRVLDVNNAYCRMTGYDRDELLTMSSADLDVSETRAQKVAHLRRAVVEGGAHFETRHRCKDGAILDISISATFVDLDGGRFVVVLRDITASKRAEETLRASEKQFRELFENAAIGKAISDLDGRYTKVNGAFCDLLGYSALELTGMAALDLTVAQDREASRLARDAALAGPNSRTVLEKRYTAKDGHTVWSLVGFAVARDSAGRPLHFVTTMQDITERKLAEEALAGSQARWQATFDAVGDAICVLDNDYTIVQANAAMNRMFGPDGSSIVSRHCWEVVHGTTCAVDGCPVDCMTRSGQSESLELWEGERCFDIAVAPILDPKAGRVGAVHWMRDITASKRAEHARGQLEKQLQMSQKLEAVGRLAGGVAHDFNNLLSVILNFTAFSLEGLRAGDPLRDNLLEVAKAGKLAADLTRQLTAFSRKQVLEPEVLDLNEIATDLERMLRRVIGADIDFEQVLATDIGLVKADPGQIEQIIMNLVVNARDAMPNGGKLTLETANVEMAAEYAAQLPDMAPGAYVQLAISDDGCGMDAATLLRVFEPFFTTKEIGKGTGLGLSTVHGIVKQSGGHISAYSEMGFGTTFKVYLPRVFNATAALSRVLSADAAGGTETILLVDDAPAIRKLAARILQAAGYTVLSAANGAEALLLCEQSPCAIQLLLTDVVMPRMTGKQLAERLAELRPGLTVLYMSGYADNALGHHGTLDPGVRFVAKPFVAVELARKVREALDGIAEKSPVHA